MRIVTVLFLGVFSLWGDEKAIFPHTPTPDRFLIPITAQDITSPQYGPPSSVEAVIQEKVAITAPQIRFIRWIGRPRLYMEYFLSFPFFRGRTQLGIRNGIENSVGFTYTLRKK